MGNVKGVSEVGVGVGVCVCVDMWKGCVGVCFG